MLAFCVTFEVTSPSALCGARRVNDCYNTQSAGTRREESISRRAARARERILLCYGWQAARTKQQERKERGQRMGHLSNRQFRTMPVVHSA